MPTGVYVRTSEYREKQRIAQSGKILTPEHKNKIRQSLIGHRVSTATRSKLRNAALHQVYRTGFMLSDETKNKLRLANLGKKQSKETVEKRRMKCIGLKRSNETRRRISRALTGFKHDEKFRQRRSELNAELFLGGDFRYKGHFYSAKNNVLVGYRSQPELILMQIFEQMDKIVRWTYEKDVVAYINHDGQKRRTIPDFHVYYTDGTDEIIEYKPSFKIRLNLFNTNEKIDAMRQYAKEKGVGFSVFSDLE